MDAGVVDGLKQKMVTQGSSIDIREKWDVFQHKNKFMNFIEKRVRYNV